MTTQPVTQVNDRTIEDTVTPETQVQNIALAQDASAQDAPPIVPPIVGTNEIENLTPGSAPLTYDHNHIAFPSDTSESSTTKPVAYPVTRSQLHPSQIEQSKAQRRKKLNIFGD